jgi:hypothetical protein
MQALCPNVVPDTFRGVSSNLGLLSLCVTEEQRQRGKAYLAEQSEADTDVSATALYRDNVAHRCLASGFHLTHTPLLLAFL